MRVGVALAAASAAMKVVLVLAVILAAEGGVLAQGGEHNCKMQEQCWQCIQTPGCAWCINPKMEMKNCQHRASINMTFCDPQDLQDPQNHVTLVQNEELAVGEMTNIQLMPQRVKLRLRKGVAQNLSIKFRRALAYPVDLYYLMDLSNSMKDDKQYLATVSKDLAVTLNNLTNHYTIGFGSFVDKVKLPFTDTTSNKLPCRGCASPYSFRNDMKLIKDREMFRRRVEEAKISGNLDSPEGGFDALMQAMVCKEEIGWRDVARRILVFSTDAKFHHAGDGRLAGVVEPNDEQCHLNERGEYTAYDHFDYPSIGQINKVAKERNINVIFAVLSYTSIYEDLTRQIETSSFGKLDQGSSNVVDLIKKQYESISSEVSLRDNSTEDVTITYSSACKGGQMQLKNKCGGIKEKEEITFNLEITANKCPTDGKGSIIEVKTLEDSVILDLEFHCSCDCPDDPDTSKCKNRGQVVCGVCDCYEGYYGEKCQCGGDEDTSGFSGGSEDQTKRCMASEEETRPCSGRGICKCGQCFCNDDNVSGKYCECDRRKCSLGLDNECSGNGVCGCNKCKCNPGFTGDLCECRNDMACKQEGSDKMCSGHGTCECGKCRCTSEGNDTYTGRYCEDCLRCGTGKCSHLRDCVQCVHFGNGPRQHDCNTCEKSELVESLDEQMFKGARLCTFEDEEGCYVNFTYRYIETQSRDEVFVQAERQCPEPPPILSIVFALIGAIVAIGLITLIIWKILTTIHDQREYAKFENESKNAKFNAEENPLYISAETTVQNPVFAAQEAQ